MLLPLVKLLLIRHAAAAASQAAAATAAAVPPPPPPCPWPAVAAAVSATGGRLSVLLYNQTQQGDTAGTAGTTGSSSDDGPAIRWAVNASHLCGGVVFFPQGEYVVNSTIELPSDTTLLGGGGRGSDQFQTAPEGAVIRHPGTGPVFLVHNGEKIRFENLIIEGNNVALIISGGALIRIINCGIHASGDYRTHSDVNTSVAGCDGCNAVLDGPYSNNTAMLVINTYWLWVEDSSFFFNIGVPSEIFGQRPSVILRGIGELSTTSGAAPGGVNTVYLTYWTRVIFSGGAVQYQQLGVANQ